MCSQLTEVTIKRCGGLQVELDGSEVLIGCAGNALIK